MTPWAATLSSVGIITLLSLVGLLTISFQGLRRHGVLFALIALAAGTLIGDAFFHLIPEAVEIWGGFELGIGFLLVAGFLMFYLLEAVLRWRHAHAEEHHDDHGHSVAVQGEASGNIRAFGILNLIGDSLHNFLDGIVVAAAFLVDTPTGIATAIAVALHELPQEFGDFGVLLRAGFTTAKAAAFNLLTGLFAFAGAILILLLPFPTEDVQRYALPIVAGGFLYIAAADLVPELHHHTRVRYVPAVVGLLVLGLGLMAALTLLE